MIRLLKILLLTLSGLVLTLVLLTTAILWQMNMLNDKGMDEALEFVQDNPPAAVWTIIKMELGLWEGLEADPLAAYR